jgi:hypothetical protein
MDALLDDVITIAGASKKKVKYASLLARFDCDDRPLSGDIAIAYLAPKHVSAEDLLPKDTPPPQVLAYSEVLRSWTSDQLRRSLPLSIQMLGSCSSCTSCRRCLPGQGQRLRRKPT